MWFVSDMTRLEIDMLTPEDRRAIEGLFDRLAEAERRAPDRDSEAEALIRSEINRHPAAPYYMAQTVVVQQQALEMAERRIEELEAQVAQRGERGGLFGGLFDDGRGRQNRPAQASAPAQRNRGPWDRAGDADDARYDRRPQPGGGGFLAGAAQTALGVAGGVLIGNAIASMFGAGAAHASEAPAQDNQQDSQQDQQQDDQPQDDGGYDSGSDFGDDGGFDTGGDF